VDRRLGLRGDIIVAGRRDDPGGRSLHFRDPPGNVIVAVQPKEQT
jgi:hypothetical protein